MTRKSMIATCVPLLLAASSQARIWWVAPSSTSLTRNGTVTYPLVGVQTGLDSAASGDTVILEEGTYAGRGYVNRGKDGIVLGSRTILDGNRTHVARTILDGQTTDTIGFGSRASILTLTLSDTLRFRIQGLTFRRGGADLGGAVSIRPGVVGRTVGAMFASVEFSDNLAIRGGAVYGGMNRFQDCLFLRNRGLRDTATASSHTPIGGAYAGDSSLVAPHGSVWIDCEFKANRSTNGGAIHERKSSEVRDCKFEGNIARNPLSPSAGAGGAILDLGSDTTRISGTTFLGNASGNIGGAFKAMLFRVEDTRFESNSSYVGGAIFSDGTGMSVINGCVFLKNEATGSAGAVMLAKIAVSNTDFVENRSGNSGAVFESAPVTAKRSRFLRNSAFQVGGVTNVGTFHCDECLISGNTAGTEGNIGYVTATTLVNSSVQGRPGSAASDFFQQSLTAQGSVVDAFMVGGSLVLNRSLFRGTRGQTTLDTAASRNYQLDVDPRFMNPAVDDLRLLSGSPAIDANDTTLDASQEPPCTGVAARRDLGYFGNTAQATCPGENLAVLSFDPVSMSRTLRTGEILRDSVRFRWTGSGSLSADSDLVLKGSIKLLTTGPLVDGMWIRFVDTARAAGSSTSTILARARAVGADIGFSLATNALSHPIDSIFAATWSSRSDVVGSTVRDTFQLVNKGANAIRIDSAKVTNGAFVLVTPLSGTTIPAGGTKSVIIDFSSASTATVRSRLRIWSRNFVRPDTSVGMQGGAYPAGSVPQAPVAVIERVEPRSVRWGGTFSALGVAWDNDALGVGAPVAAWEWVLGSDTIRAPSIASRPTTGLPLGWNRIAFRAKDNEGTWSPNATDSVFVEGVPPVVDSTRASKGLVLRQDGPLVLSVVAHDADENAQPVAGRDSIRTVVWRSDLDSVLGTGKTLSVPASKLRIGVHSIWATVFDDEGDSAVSDTLRIPVQASIGLAVVVAGTSFGDIAYFQGNISPNANWIYQTLLSRGYSHDQIWYANRIGWQSLSDPFVDAKIVDETAITKKVLGERILSLKGAVEAGTPLLISLVGHGDASEQDGGRFFLNDSEWVTPWDLNNWLAEFDAIDPTGRIVVVLDFCESGAFQTALRTGFDRSRVVVTSSDATHASYFSRGKGFSQVFFAGVRKGRSVGRSFEDAKSWSDLVGAQGVPANPLLNADMDGAFNTAADRAAGALVWIGGSQQTQDPEPVIDTAWIAPAPGGAMVLARLAGTAGKAWAEYATTSDRTDAAPLVVAMAPRPGEDGIWQVQVPPSLRDSTLRQIVLHASSSTGALAFPWVIDALGSFDGNGALRGLRTARYDRSSSRIRLGRGIEPGAPFSVEFLDVSGRILGRVESRADASGWVEVEWKPGRTGFHLVRETWPSGRAVERVMVTEVGR